MTVTCASCGVSFKAKRSTAKYCGPTCRKRGARTKGSPGNPAPPPGLIAAVTKEIDLLGKADSLLGSQALVIAKQLAAGRDTGSAVAALSRELTSLMQQLRAGATKVEDEVEKARRRRDEKRSAAGQASG